MTKEGVDAIRRRFNLIEAMNPSTIVDYRDLARDAHRDRGDLLAYIETNEQTLAEAIALLRVLVAYSHEPLPQDLLEHAATFLERFPYEQEKQP
jgi:hypothetical protein